MQPAIMFRQHRDGRVITHRANCFLGILDHRLNQELKFLQRMTGRELSTTQFIAIKLSLLITVSPDQTVHLSYVPGPLFERRLPGHELAQFAIVIKTTFIELYGNSLTRTNAALFNNPRFIHRDHAGFRPYYQKTIFAN